MREFNDEKRDCSIVLIGKFNPEMFSPDWFLKNGVIREEDAQFAKSQKDKYPMIVSNQLTMFITNNLTIKIEMNRFTISANKEPFVELKDFVCKTFNNLGALEINAYGFNYGAHYHLNSVHEYQIVGDKLAPKDYWKELLGDEVSGDERKSGLSAIRMMKTFDYGALSLQLEPSAFVKYGVFMTCNDHHNVSKDSNDAYTVVSEIESLFEESIEKMKNQQKTLLNEVLKNE